MSGWREFLGRVVRRVVGLAGRSWFCVRSTAVLPEPSQPGWEAVPKVAMDDPEAGGRALAALVNGRATVVAHVIAGDGSEQCVVVAPRAATCRRR